MTSKTTKTITNLDLVIEKTENEIDELMSVLEDLENQGKDLDYQILTFDKLSKSWYYKTFVAKEYQDLCDEVKEKQDLLQSYYEIQEMEF
jgi:hypothetical protein